MSNQHETAKPKRRGGARPGAGRPATGLNPQLAIRVAPEIKRAVDEDPDGAREALRRWAERRDQ